MIIWINGAFGAGKTTTAYELHRRIPNSFLYDPEHVGYFIRKKVPKSILKSDFQDHVMWREMNFSMLHEMGKSCSEIIIVPMTIVNPQYFTEVVQKLRDSGVEINHFTLMASRQTLLKRLKSRGDNEDSWPAQQINRCIASLTEEIFKHHVDTDQLTTEDIIDYIAKVCHIELQPDRRGYTRKRIDRLIMQLRKR